MSPEQNKKIVRNFFAFGNEGKIDKCLDLLADDITWEDTGTTRFSGIYRGKQCVVEDLIGPLFGGLKAGIQSEIEDVIAEEDRVVVVSRGTAETHEGVPYNNRYCQVFRVRDGKISSVLEFFDTALADRVFGARE